MESGDYLGWYNRGDGQVPHTMEMNLQFHGHLLVSGRGIDDVGHFTISGKMTSGSIAFTKSYSSHDVEYDGNIDSNGNGRIWGTWNIRFGGGEGGFILKPRRGDGLKRENEATEEIQDPFPIVGMQPIRIPVFAKPK